MRSHPRHLSQIGSSLHHAILAGAAAKADTPEHSNPAASTVLAVPADACVHEPLRRAYVSPASSLGSASITLACGVHQSLSAGSQSY